MCLARNCYSTKRGRDNNALKLTKREVLSVGALRAPSSLSRASQLSAVLDGRCR
jgi:hypothetical protein